MTDSTSPLEHDNLIQRRSTEEGLCIVAVPIGNLEDITVRALRILREADLIACEDTRKTRQLLQLLHLPIPKLISCHEYNEVHRISQLVTALNDGQRVALVSDAGTPNISDPGYRIIQAVIKEGIKVTPIPGACAAITALSASGLPTDRFRFIGFLSAKKKHRRTQLEGLSTAQETLIFYESPHRLHYFLEDAIVSFTGQRSAVIARELTKRYEELRRGTLEELAEAPGLNRGELVILIEGMSQKEASAQVDLDTLIHEVLDLKLSPSASAKELAKRSMLNRKEAYLLLQKANQSGSSE